MMLFVMWIIAILLGVIVRDEVVVGCNYGLELSCPGKSCRDVYHRNSGARGNSGLYIINTNRLHVVYCDMELECGGEKGWMRIASVDAANDSCPSGWNRITSPAAACRAITDMAGCHSSHFPTHNVPYNRVCGMVIGYQKGSTDGFGSYHYPSRSINGPYLDGVSITYGITRKHIWSYVIGHSKTVKYDPVSPACPCSQFPGQSPPSFVHEHYYCESGRLLDTGLTPYYTDDPVWDGNGCPTENSCCSDPSLPWFYHQIPLTVNKNFEVRICYDEPFSNEGVLVKQFQLYVQ